MLTHLYIRDFALIEELSLAFSSGLTIITGETGAGKSILMGALNQVLGVRASTDLVRSGSKKAVIEATLTGYDRTRTDQLLEDAGIDSGEEIILRREIQLKGQSRCFINDTPCTVQVLRQIGDQLIDLHGQHEHQLLLHQETHGVMLDQYASIESLTTQYSIVYQQLQEERKKLLELTMRAEMLEKQKGMLEYQHQELMSLNLKIDEEAGLEEEILLLENAETLTEQCDTINDELYDNERSAFVLISEAVHHLEKLARIDTTFIARVEELQNARSLVEELSRTLRSYGGGIEYNQEQLENLRERQLKLQKIKKKYGKSIEELLLFQDELSQELSLQEDLDDRLKAVETTIASLKTTLSAIAIEIHDARQKASFELQEIISGELAGLGIPHSEFRVHLSAEASPDGDISANGECYRAFHTGYDIIEFLISTNPGEEPKPLGKVASGGEISRIMLALKRALATNARLPILVFDEIDTGISGAVAEAVGKSLKMLSRLHQIISITHLPQIAAMADTHLFVEKNVHENRTHTTVRQLDAEEHLKAVAQLFGGHHPSDASLKVAAQLLGAAKGI